MKLFDDGCMIFLSSVNKVRRIERDARVFRAQEGIRCNVCLADFMKRARDFLVLLFSRSL